MARLPKIGSSGTRESAQRTTLEAFAREGIDIAPAKDLTGSELDAWIDATEEELFQREFASFTTKLPSQ